MSALSAVPAEILHQILQLSQVKTDDITTLSPDAKPLDELASLHPSILQPRKVKEDDKIDILQASKPARELAPLSPSISQLSPVNEKGSTAISQDIKQVHDIALFPDSFDTINWTWAPIQKALSSDPPISQLLLMLLENPDLGARIKHLSFSGEFALRNQDAAPIRLSEREMKTVQDMIHEAQFPMASMWIKDLELGTINVFVALVLSQLVGLQTLHLDADFMTDTQFLGLLFKHALLPDHDSARRVSTFPALRNVKFALTTRCEHEGMRDGVALDRDQFKILLYLSAIEMIEAVIFQQRTFNWPTPIPPIASNLKILNLPNCELDENGLRRILSATPNLEILTYNRWCDIDPPWELCSGLAANYDLDKLDMALTKVKATLRRLSLSIYFFAGTALDLDEPDDTFGIINDPWPYKKYEKLEYLEISFVILFGYHQTCTPVQRMNDLLPRSIRHLCLSDDMAHYLNYEWDAQACLERLRELISGRHRLLPHLGTITLRLRYSSESQWDESAQGELKALCTGANLACTIDKVVYIE